ncbi:hypothetical protein J1N35_028290 [Gossypium stocksii]|uniref:Reverse transcriptase zinc-binding domain-containing protein n=1 Tax=Gossypium stocksii TaxID=47602 RepID=A0A9D3UVW3_9ROSI|nr:hypothetical protein J1N35_028290 [Gossypium stocksii]
MVDICPESIYRNSCSHAWRSLPKVWNEVRNKIIWSVLNGETLKFWMDNWVPDTGPLWDARITSHGINKMATVREFVGEDGNWKWGVLSAWLSQLVLLHISGIAPPRADLGPDVICLNGMDNGHFSISDIYTGLTERTWRANNTYEFGKMSQRNNFRSIL